MYIHIYIYSYVHVSTTVYTCQCMCIRPMPMSERVSKGRCWQTIVLVRCVLHTSFRIATDIKIFGKVCIGEAQRMLSLHKFICLHAIVCTHAYIGKKPWHRCGLCCRSCKACSAAAAPTKWSDCDTLPYSFLPFESCGVWYHARLHPPLPH